MTESKIRKYLVSKLQAMGMPTLSEVNLIGGLARVDLIALNNGVHGFEIKSDEDTLARLSKQVATYTKVFNTITIVCTEKHLQGVFEVAPEWFGIMSYSGGGLTVYRETQINPMIQARFILRSMSQREVNKYLNANQSLAQKVGSKYQSVADQIDRGSVSESEIVSLFEGCLKVRT